MRRTILFLDVDGVLSIINPENIRYGYAPRTWEWAAGEPRVRLIDTTEETMLAILLANPADKEAAAREFVHTYLL